MKRLSGWDSVLLYSEAPNVHMHTIKAAVIELDADRRSLDVAAFRQVIAGRLNKLDPFCYQLVEVPFSFHHPMWRENCEIDLDYHIRPWRVSPPGGRRELDEAIGQIAARGMDLQPGPEGGPYVCDPPPTTRQLMVSAFADHLRHVGRLPHTIRYTAQGLGRVRRSARKLSPELTRPFEPPPTFMNHKLTPERRFATATLALADVKGTGKRLGATINDMVLAMSTGALRTLLLRYDGQAQPLLASVPVSFDFSPERISGNRFTGMLVALPVDHDDPLERVAACHQNAISAKESHQLMGPELVSRWAAYMPPAPTRAFFQWASARDGHNKILNLNISNVPGPRERGRVGGALVTEIYSVGPLTAGSGLNITVWSYVDQLNISVLTDGATCKDPHEVTEAMVQDFIEIRRAAGFSEDLTVVEAAMAPA